MEAAPSARAWSYFPNQAGETGRTGASRRAQEQAMATMTQDTAVDR
jgi:hypothetical protein